MKKVKAIVLFSGGLDSRLAVKILDEQGMEIICLHFILPFGSGCCSDSGCVFNFGQKEGVMMKFIDCAKGKNFRDYLKIVRQPKFGRGSGLNPCLDCRIFMLKKAKALMKKMGADLLVTGEVLGQRPMSQHLRAMKLTEKEAGLEGKILRPLSAQLLPETEAEKKGLVKREKLLAISGRRRLPQMELAKKFNLRNFPQPAGGCLLTDQEFSRRLRWALENFKKLDENDTELLKIGRFWPQEKILIIVGRNQMENESLEQLARRKDILVSLADTPGPTTLIRYWDAKQKNQILQRAKELTQHYAIKARNELNLRFLIKYF